MSFSKAKKSIAAMVFSGLCLMPVAGWAQEHLPANIITVQGAGTVSTQPDAFQLQMGVETEAKTLETARNENARKMNAVVQRVKSLTIPNLVLQTSGFSVYPIREVQPATAATRRTVERIVGYRVSNQLNAKVEGGNPNRLGEDASRILDTALAVGANNADGINFYLSRNNTAQKEALRLAVKQARDTAETVAQAAGVKLSGIYSIEAYAQPVPMRMESFAKAMPMADAMPTPIESGKFDVTANVTVRFDFQD